MTRAQIISTGAYLPGPPITNSELETIAGPLAGEVLTEIRVTQRHWLIDLATGEHRESTSGMANTAARQALERANLSVDDVDLLVTCTGSPEFAIPSMAGFLQDKLGLAECMAIELRGGCAGSLQALDIARLYIERGDAQSALVVGSEAISPSLAPLFLGQDPELVRMRDRLALYLFGDGAGALLLRASDSDEGIRSGTQGSIGGGRKPGVQVVGGGTHAPLHQQRTAPRLQEVRMNVGEIDRMTARLIVQGLTATLRGAALEPDVLDCCVLPEGSASVLSALCSADLCTTGWERVASKVVDNTPLVGATGSATMPLAIDYASATGSVRDGDRVMVLAIETTKWSYAGTVTDWTIPARAATIGDGPPPNADLGP